MISRFSLRARLTFVAVAITLVALVAADFVVYAEFRSYLFGRVDATLENAHPALEHVADEANGPTSDQNSPPPSQPQDQGPGGETSFCQLGGSVAPGMFIEVRTSAGRIVSGEDGLEYCKAFEIGAQLSQPQIPEKITAFLPSSENPKELVSYFSVSSLSGKGPSYRVRASTLANGDYLVIADPVGDVANSIDRLVRLEILVTVVAFVSALVISLVLIRLGLRPLRDVERTADAITGGDLIHRVPNPNPKTEVGHVATALNVMLDGIEGAFEDLKSSEGRLRRFVSDASHELRTPIAAVSAYAELYRRGASADQADLARVLSGIERESERMARLVEDLLTLARLDEHASIAHEPVELVGLAHEAIETGRTVGPEWRVDLQAGGPIEVFGDRDALRRIIDNLLSNLRSHTPQGTHATLSVRREGDSAILELADEGPGISETEARTIFERFVRVDPSRSRTTGGAGLGLAIVASVARAHRGWAEAAPGPGGGAIFRVVLPALDTEQGEPS
ncbi:MAG: HAMP domain-containing sensor histidine kinase [Acidimicrobiales bacterium]